MDLLTIFLPDAEEMVAVETLLKVVDTRAEFVIWLSL